MHTVDLNDLDLMEGRIDGDPTMQWTVTFPFFAALGTESLAMVYFEIEPGKALAEHTDSAEEVVLVLEGEVEATLGDESGHMRTGGMVLIPPMVPHGVRNVGDRTARCVGFFASPNLVSTFHHPVMPIGLRVFKTEELGAVMKNRVGEAG